MILPSLRRDLDVMPSPVPNQPGLLIRDSLRYSEAVIVVPWALARSLECFDGRHTEADLRETLARDTGMRDVDEIQRHIIGALRDSFFLEDEDFTKQRRTKHEEFVKAERRFPAHAGSAYPVEPSSVRETMDGYLERGGLGESDVVAIAAPHVSPSGGWKSYQAAYRTLPRDIGNQTIIILGTSHYGAMNKFGLTRKRFETPLGISRTNERIVDRLATRAAAGVLIEDYCHSIEHSIEFQVLFLQWIYGPDISIVPILCGSFAESILHGGAPEKDDGVHRFLSELRNLSEAEGDQIRWVLGVDMAHIGRRYGDSFVAESERGYLQEVALRDRARNEQITSGNAVGFWELVQETRDDLRWCGAAPIYTFLKAAPRLRGNVERYEQWNIDEASVVSFAGISFRRD